MKPLAVSLVMLLCAAGVACPLAAAQDQEEAQQEQFKVTVKLVNVFATVVDENGAPVAGLQKGDFLVMEDGEPQKISVFERESGAPLSIVLAVDTSLSTRKDLKLELESAQRFVQSILRPVDALSLYEFKETVQELVPFTNDMARIDHRLFEDQLARAEGALGLGARSTDRFEQVAVLGHQPHAAAAAAGRRFHHHRQADLVRLLLEIGIALIGALVARHAGHAGLDHAPLGGRLVAHRRDRGRRRADEDQPGLLAG